MIHPINKEGKLTKNIFSLKSVMKYYCQNVFKIVSSVLKSTFTSVLIFKSFNKIHVKGGGMQLW